MSTADRLNDLPIATPDGPPSTATAAERAARLLARCRAVTAEIEYLDDELTKEYTRYRDLMNKVFTRREQTLLRLGLTLYGVTLDPEASESKGFAFNYTDYDGTSNYTYLPIVWMMDPDKFIENKRALLPTAKQADRDQEIERAKNEVARAQAKLDRLTAATKEDQMLKT